jgi:hypothetical protein
MTKWNTNTIWATSKKISGVTGISHGWLYINTMKCKRLQHLHPYKTPVVHKFYHSENEAKWISWTANFRTFILEKTTHIFCLAVKIHVILVSELSTSYSPTKYHVNLMSDINFYPTRVIIYISVQGLWQTGLFQHKKIKWLNKQYFMENITEIMQHVLKIQYISLLPKYTKYISRGVVLCSFAMLMQVLRG